HYFFASGTAHMTALYLPFLSVAVATGAPLGLSAMLLAFTGAINASTTHYANGPASILATTGYVKQGEWWKMNFVLGLIYMIIFGTVGVVWMKIIGLW
ncbi:MAG: anion permease, partial [Lactobacillus crispatus]|nr:anion permease [Lactobacillus crispatus]